ncbi:hypothetical protein Ciccas_009258 [Cichlidogyrus casuarinus]|uniref:EGF-like domain-containing protein n=1 Tax=Cichlidogyrus casuarinus TaxID=1844966 RepID=A0ABD2PXJ4_9PLAT
MYGLHMDKPAWESVDEFEQRLKKVIEEDGSLEFMNVDRCKTGQNDCTGGLICRYRGPSYECMCTITELYKIPSRHEKWCQKTPQTSLFILVLIVVPFIVAAIIIVIREAKIMKRHNKAREGAGVRFEPLHNKLSKITTDDQDQDRMDLLRA